MILCPCCSISPSHKLWIKLTGNARCQTRLSIYKIYNRKVSQIRIKSDEVCVCVFFLFVTFFLEQRARTDETGKSMRETVTKSAHHTEWFMKFYVRRTSHTRIYRGDYDRDAVNVPWIESMQYSDEDSFCFSIILSHSLSVLHSVLDVCVFVCTRNYFMHHFIAIDFHLSKNLLNVCTDTDQH